MFLPKMGISEELLTMSDDSYQGDIVYAPKYNKTYSISVQGCQEINGHRVDAAKSSMEIGVRIESENLLTGEVKHTASAYLTFVALDKAGRPTHIPPLVLETEEEKQRNSEAQTRRKNRLAFLYFFWNIYNKNVDMFF